MTEEVSLSDRFKVLARTIRTTRPGYVLSIIKRWNLILMWRSASEIAAMENPDLYKSYASNVAFIERRAKLFIGFGVSLYLMTNDEAAKLLTELPRVTYGPTACPLLEYKPQEADTVVPVPI